MPSRGSQVTVRLHAHADAFERTFSFGRHWNRFGLALCTNGPATATIEWVANIVLSFWGLTGGAVTLPQALERQRVTHDDLLHDHLVPETFYFSHEAAVDLELSADDSSRLMNVATVVATLG